MSEFLDRLNAMKTDLETAVPGITVVVGFKDPTTVNKEDFPWATLFDPSEVNTPVDFQQYERAVTARCIYVRGDGEFAAAATDLDAIRDELESDPLLAGTVSGVHRIAVTRRVVNESVDETGRLRAGFEIVLEEDA